MAPPTGLLGELAALLGREDDAERHLREAIALNEAMGATVWASQSREALSALRPASPRVQGFT